MSDLASDLEDLRFGEDDLSDLSPEEEELQFSREFNRVLVQGQASGNESESPQSSLSILSEASLLDTFPRPFHDQQQDITPALMRETGVDCQGIPWAAMGITRAEFRQQRDQDYRQRVPTATSVPVTLPIPAATQGDDARTPPSTSSPLRGFFRFAYFSRGEGCSISHWQLRHLLAMPTAAGVLYPSAGGRIIRRWNPLSNRTDSVYRLQGGQVLSCLAATEECVWLGGFRGEVIRQSLNSGEVRSWQVSLDDNGIVNHLRVNERRQELLISNNDGHLRILNLSTLGVEEDLTLPWSINASATQGRVVACVGDGLEVLLYDLREEGGRPVMRLQGHEDHCFALDWHPTQRVLVSGSQDGTARLWDLRAPDTAADCLKGKMAAIRNCQFSPDGRWLAMMEADDYCHLHRLSPVAMPKSCQTVDFFGEAAGIAWAPHSGRLYLGCSGSLERSGIFEWELDRCDELELYRLE